MVTFLDILFFTRVRASARDTNFGFFKPIFHPLSFSLDKLFLQTYFNNAFAGVIEWFINLHT